MYGRFLGSSVVTIAMLIAMSPLCGVASSWHAAAMTPQTDLSELPLTFPVQSPEVAAYFNQIARPQDIASFPTPFVSLLPQVTAGQRMVVFASWADAERDLEALTGQIDLVMYNPEHWESTPASEQQNLTATVQRAAEYVHARGLRFMLAPDRRFAQEHLGQVAPYVDAILLQGQRLQDDSQAFASWMREMSNIARASNPEVQIYAQVGATRSASSGQAWDTASEMSVAIQSVSNDVDGIAVWSMPRSLNVLQEFVTLIRERPPAIPATATGTFTPAPATVLPDETVVATPLGEGLPTEPPVVTVLPDETVVATSTPGETIVETYPPTVLPTRGVQPPQVEQDAQAVAWLKGIALIAVGVVIGLLLGVGLARRRRGG